MIRCYLCGCTSYELSVGGPNICPACDAGNFVDRDLALKRMLGLKPHATSDERYGRPDPPIVSQECVAPTAWERLLKED